MIISALAMANSTFPMKPERKIRRVEVWVDTMNLNCKAVFDVYRLDLNPGHFQHVAVWHMLER